MYVIPCKFPYLCSMFDDKILIGNQQVRQFLSHPLGQLVPPHGTDCPTPWDKF